MKLYADEPGAALVRKAVKRAELIATHLIAYAETRAALARKHRLEQMDGLTLVRLKKAFERDWNTLHHLPANEIAVRRAGDLAEQHHLRGYDSLHLAAAELLQNTLLVPITFACFDNNLNSAASKHGMQMLAR